mmetsp:Transcript_20710/g.50858  ORF Transcript_20710/g.50858 Transcript_20710/m.50858 type:complete len:210 (+) Transcript_20710:626-1255(+)
MKTIHQPIVIANGRVGIRGIPFTFIMICQPLVLGFPFFTTRTVIQNGQCPALNQLFRYKKGIHRIIRRQPSECSGLCRRGIVNCSNGSRKCLQDHIPQYRCRQTCGFYRRHPLGGSRCSNSLLGRLLLLHATTTRSWSNPGRLLRHKRSQSWYQSRLGAVGFRRSDNYKDGQHGKDNQHGDCRVYQSTKDLFLLKSSSEDTTASLIDRS